MPINIFIMRCATVKMHDECVHVLRLYLRIVLAVPIDAYRHVDVRVLDGLLQVVSEQMYLSCEVVDTLHWGGEGTTGWTEGGLSCYKLARLQLKEVNSLANETM